MTGQWLAYTLALLIPTWAMAQATVQENRVTKTLHVNAQAAAASDQADGSEGAPLKTIGRALHLAQQANAQRAGVRILLHPGVYREEVRLHATADKTDAPIIIEAAERGSAIIEGADRWNDWNRIEGSSVYSYPWPYRIGMWEIPPGWEGVTVYDIVRRQEIILTDGKLLRQVLSPVELREGTFFVSEDKSTAYLYPPAGVDPNTANTQVAVRSGVSISGYSNLVVRGITVQHTTKGDAFNISQAKNILVEDVLVQWNDRGASMVACTDITARRFVSNHNGNTGMGGYRLGDLLFEDTETSYNNWRGHWGDFTGWAVAGLKYLVLRNATFRRHKSVGNETGGFWLDFDNHNVVIDGAWWADNLAEGIFVEANPGPITIQNSTICYNHGAGILSTNSEGVTVRNNVLYGNTGAQITLTGIEDRDVEDYTAGRVRKLKIRSWTLKDNILGGSGPSSPLLDISYAGVEPFLATLAASGNLYSTSDASHVVRLTGMDLGLSDWQAASGQDLGSLVADARFADPQNRNFACLPDSPVHNRASWPVAQVKRSGLAGLRAQKQKLIEENWSRPYPLAAVATTKWHQIDLKPYANRPLWGPDAGVAGPLDHLTPGPHTIHGVPFQVIDQARNGGAAAIALCSSQLPGSMGKALPTEVVVPVGVQAKAIYLLHGAGYAGTHTRIGTYTLMYEDGGQTAIDVVALGPGAKDLDLVKKVEAESNVQDWWPTNPQFETDNARKVIIAPRDNPLGDLRYLYTLQWVNPQPARMIKEIRLASDPAQPGTLMIVSATALLPE